MAEDRGSGDGGGRGSADRGRGEDVRTGLTAVALEHSYRDHLRFGLGRFPRVATPNDRYLALACAKLLLTSGAQRRAPEEAAGAAGYRSLLDAHDTVELLEHCGVPQPLAERVLGLY